MILLSVIIIINIVHNTNNNNNNENGNNHQNGNNNAIVIILVRIIMMIVVTRKGLRTIYYLSTLAQWLFFISDDKYYPKSLHGLCCVRELFLEYLQYRLHVNLRE